MSFFDFEGGPVRSDGYDYKKLTIKYRLLFKAEDLSNCFVPQQLAADYWEEIFSQPWILPDDSDISA